MSELMEPGGGTKDYKVCWYVGGSSGSSGSAKGRLERSAGSQCSGARATLATHADTDIPVIGT